jgi:hypothetical protein
MKKTLQDQYLLIKEGKGHVGVFLTEAKRQFPNIVRNAATFDEAVASLKTKNIISENVISVMPAIMDRPKKESYETAFEAFLAEAKKKNEDEKVKAEEKKVSKPVEEDLEKNFDYSDEKNPDNMIFGQIMMGYYAEMKDPKNADKTMQQLKDIVFKNLAKNQIYYTENTQFGVKDIGYSVDHPGLGEPKEAKGKYKSSGYGDLKESINEIIYNDPQPNPLKDLTKMLVSAGVNAELRGLNYDFIRVDDNRYEISLQNGMYRVRDLSKAGSPIVGEYNVPQEVVNYFTKSSNSSFPKEYRPFHIDRSLEETKLRKVIREMIEGELEEVSYQIYNIRPRTSDKERGERDTPSSPQSQKIPSLVVKKLERRGLKMEDGVIKMPKLLQIQIQERPKQIDFIYDLKLNRATYPKYNALADSANYVTYDTNHYKFKNATLNDDGSITIKQSTPLKGTNEASLGVVNNDIEVKSFPVDLPISYSDDKNVAHYSDDNEYDSQDDLLDVEDYLNQIKGMSKGNAFDYLKEMGLERDEILTVLRNHKSLSLRESVEKDLMDINKEAEHEVLQSKLDKIDALIDLRRSKLGKLDEDEDMKALTDKKKVKELEKDIKKLEVARNKVEKMMSKFKGKKSSDKKVIDEDEPIEEDLDVAAEYVEDATERLDAGQNVGSIGDTYSNMGRNQKSNLIDYLNTIAPDDLKSDYVY